MKSHRYARTCLEYLDLRPGATWEDVKRAHRTLVQVWHPDRFAKGTAKKFKAEERFNEVTAAYAWLKENPSFLEDLARGWWGDEDRDPDSARRSKSYPPAGDGSASVSHRGWFRQRYESLIYAVRRWIPRVRVPWVFFGALAVGGYIVLRGRDPDVTPLLGPQVFQSVTDAIEELAPESLWVYDQRIDLRELPGGDSPLAGFLERGRLILVTDTVEGWRKVVDRSSAALVGWVRAIEVGPQPPSAGNAVAPDRRETPAASTDETGRVRLAPVASAEEVVRSPIPESGVASGREASRSLKHWAESTSFVTEPFEVPQGSLRLVFKTIAAGSVNVQLYAMETNRLIADVWRADAGESSFPFEGGGTYRIRVTASGVPWEASVEVAR